MPDALLNEFKLSFPTIKILVYCVFSSYCLKVTLLFPSLALWFNFISVGYYVCNSILFKYHF